MWTSNKQYIGDGVYVDVEGSTGGVLMTTEDGYRATNTIIMEPRVLQAFLEWVNRNLSEDEKFF